MKLYWPRRSQGLPPGQRLLDQMPRFTDNPFAPPPWPPADSNIAISVEGTEVARLGVDDLEALGPRDFEAEFHCVTTWSVTGLTWTGVPLRDVLASVGLDPGRSRFMVAKAHDRRRAHFLTADALGEDVIVATHLNGELLGALHGGPVRLVAPRQYGYKSVKHLASINFTSRPPANTGKEHLRGRVALQERHPKVPSWLVKVPYRLLIAPTAYFAERTLRNHQPGSASAGRASVTSSMPPSEALVVSTYDSPDYLDCFATDAAPEQFDTVDDVATAWFTEQPGWLRFVSTGTLSKRRLHDAITADGYRVGTSVGSWEVVERTEDEIVFGDDMGFMQYRFSFCFDPDANQIHATTIVKYLWPRTGRYYFAMVRPLHQRFIKLLLAKTVDSRPNGR